MKNVLLVPFVLCLCVSCSSTPDRPESVRTHMEVSPTSERTSFLDRTPRQSELVTAVAQMNPVVVAPGAFGVIDVYVRVQPGWHFYPAEVKGDGIPLRLVLDSGGLFTTEGPWLMPPPKPGPDGLMYEGNLQFRRKIRVSPRASLGQRQVATVAFTYQARDPSVSMPPKTIPITVEYVIGTSN